MEAAASSAQLEMFDPGLFGRLIIARGEVTTDEATVIVKGSHHTIACVLRSGKTSTY